MGQPNRQRRRRRPGRRPPYRYRPPHTASPADAARPRGYSAPGARQIYDLVLPFRGPEKRACFNGAAGLTTVMLGIAAGIMGYGIGGPLGALFGFGVGLAASGRYLENNRFFRA